LVREAQAAELAGDNARRAELLAQALKEDPNCRVARWQAGFADVGGTWLTVDEAARQFAADQTLADYRRRREVTASEAELARWCRTKRLADEEWAHWTQVLLKDHGNREALTRLGLHRFARGLYTSTQIEGLKRQAAAEQKLFAESKPTVSRWRRAVNEGSRAERAAAIAEMASAKTPAFIPALEWANASDEANHTRQSAVTPFQREAVKLIGRLPDQRATYSLTIHALLAKQSELRALTADELKKRPLHDFVPMLLASLTNPIQLKYGVSFDEIGGTATYDSQISREGQDGNYVIVNTKTVYDLVPRFETGYMCSQLTMFRSMPSTDAGTLAGNWKRQADQLASSIERTNERTDAINSRVEEVLERVTGVTKAPNTAPESDTSEVIPDSTTAPQTVADYWWSWWSNYNEAAQTSKPEHVVQYSTYTPDQGRKKYAEASIRPNGSLDPPHHSCFAAGTQVLSSVGSVAIETLRIGDRVLAQDPATGELTYKPILATSKTPSAKLLRVTTSQGTVRLTRGHPFWIVGKGWRMAKELSVGDRIHGLQGGASVTAISEEPEESVYNLNVADFATYFVGDAQLLVHDFSIRLPIRAVLPGYTPRETN
jgi:hypothetical protein